MWNVCGIFLYRNCSKIGATKRYTLGERGGRPLSQLIDLYFDRRVISHVIAFFVCNSVVFLPQINHLNQTLNLNLNLIHGIHQ